MRAEAEAPLVDQHSSLSFAPRKKDRRPRERGDHVRQAVAIQIGDCEAVHPFADVCQAIDVAAFEQLPASRRIAHGIGIGELLQRRLAGTFRGGNGIRGPHALLLVRLGHLPPTHVSTEFFSGDCAISGLRRRP